MISLSAYTSLFKFNGSTYVEQQADGAYKRIFKALTKDDLYDHLEHRRVLAMYPSVAGDCQLGCIDLDIPHDRANDKAQWDILEEKIANMQKENSINGNQIWKNVIRKRRMLPTATFTEYLKTI